MKSHVGTDIINKFVENTPEYQNETNTSKQDDIKKDAFKRWSTYLLIQNSDQAKYGSLMSGLISQYSMDHNQYPKTITTAMDILSNHKHDNRKKCNGYHKPKKKMIQFQQ